MLNSPRHISGFQTLSYAVPGKESSSLELQPIQSDNHPF